MNDVLTPLGALPNGWDLKPLGCLTSKVGSGATPRGGAATYLESRQEFAFIRSQCIHDLWFDSDAISFISNEQAYGLRNATVRSGDVLLNITGDGVTFGRACLVPDAVLPACVNQHVAIVRALPDKLDPGFLVRFLAHPGVKTYIESFNAGGSRRAITKGHIESFLIPLPPLEDQQAIASTLGAFDDKIELNRRMNETLDATARAIFKDWFVDFGPTRAKAEGRAPYLDPDLWDLFPDALDDDKPVGWKRERIGNHIVAKKGLSYKGAGLTDKTNGMPLHNLNSILEGGGYKNDGLKFYSGDYKPRHIVRPADLIVANTEQGFDHLLIGYSALVPAWVAKEGLFSHHIFKVEPRSVSPLSRVWLHFALSASWFGEAIRRFSNGTTVNMLPQDAFEIPEIIVPSSELVRAFDQFVGPSLRRQEDSVGESRTLAQTRDLLLPKLMSGEIRLPHAEEAVEAVA